MKSPNTFDSMTRLKNFSFKPDLRKKIQALVLLFLLLSTSSSAQWKHGRLVVSPDHRMLQYADGTPFFWLGDTGWQLFSRLTMDEVNLYLDNRAAKGFNVIQAEVLGEFLEDRANLYGYPSLVHGDIHQPEERHFKRVDSIVSLCRDKGLFVLMVAAWGDYILPAEGRVTIDSANAYGYGRWIGERYKDFPNIIWALGGDVPIEREGKNYLSVWREMAKGIKEATNGKCLITYHPNGYRSSSEWLQNEDWLDFNMIQSSHGEHNAPTWKFVKHDLTLSPARPTIDGELNYEDHPVAPWPVWHVDSGYFRDYDVRKQMYRSVFAGALGVTYGHHAVWQFVNARTLVINFADRGWINALDRPGAVQSGFLKKLIESRPFGSRIADSSLVNGGLIADKNAHMEAFRNGDNSYAMIYMPIGHSITVNPSFIKSGKYVAWWFNPRDGKASRIGLFNAKNEKEFQPPTTGVENDWVLVLDDENALFPPPGTL